MTASYEDEWRVRFGDAAGIPGEVPELPWLHQLLLRRTHRRYADRQVSEPLLRLLLAAAFSASSKSDFQQAAVIRSKRDDWCSTRCPVNSPPRTSLILSMPEAVEDPRDSTGR